MCWQQMFFFASSSAQILTENFIAQGKVETMTKTSRYLRIMIDIEGAPS